MKTCTASGIVSRTWRAPWMARRGAPLELGAQGPVAAAGVDRVLDEVSFVDATLEI
jgi:hypothetical protein